MDPDAFQFHKVPDTAQHRFRGHLLISDQVSAADIKLVWRELEHVLGRGVPGAVVEFGCYAGTTSLFIRRLLDERGQSSVRAFHAYDSFEGLPAKAGQDQSAAGADFQAGKLSVSKKEFLHQFKAAHLMPPVTHKGWFGDLHSHDVPPQIAFAFLDGDFYDSIMDSLKLVWPRLAPGGVMLVDDYQRPELPGPERAVRAYFNHDMPPVRVAHNIAVINKNPGN
jgi:O-methyltransferase